MATTVSDYLSELYRIISLIRASIIRKGGALTERSKFADYAAAIDGIVTAGNAPSYDWKPNDSWWDIESILKADTTEGYVGKLILLISDLKDSTFLSGANAYRTSDGKFYEANATHVWDTSKDKDSTDGYKTRYIIYYFTAAFGAPDLSGLIEARYLVSSSDISIVAAPDYWQGNNYKSISIPTELRGIKTINGAKLYASISRDNTSDYIRHLEYLSPIYSVNTFTQNYFNSRDYDVRDLAACFFQDGNVKSGEMHLSPVYNTNSSSLGMPLSKQLIKLTIVGETSTMAVDSTSGCSYSYFNIYINSNDAAKKPLLSSIEIKGVQLRFSSIDLSPCPFLTHKALVNVINGVQDETGGTNRTLKVNQYSFGLLTTSDKQVLAAKNWTLSLVTL